MPNIKSAAKRVRTSEKDRLRNLEAKSGIKSIRKRFFEAVDKKEKESAAKLYTQYCSALDKTAKKGIIGKNTASRRKARAAEKIRGL